MEKILNILGEIRPDVNFQKSKKFVDDQLLDSLDLIRLVSEIEKNYNVSINGADMVPENFNDLDSIQLLINRSNKK